MFTSAGIRETIAEIELGRMSAALAEASESAHRDLTCRVGNGDYFDRGSLYEVVEKRIGISDRYPQYAHDIHGAFKPDMTAGQSTRAIVDPG